MAKRTSPTGYIPIQKYLTASPETKLGETLGAGVSREVEEYQKELKSEGEKFREGLQGKDIATPESEQERKDIIETPYDVTESEIEKFQTFLSPKADLPSTERLQQLQSTGSGIGQLGEAPSSSLLQRYLGTISPTGKAYTRGQRSLDELLLGSTPSMPLQQARRGALQALGSGKQAVTTAENIGKVIQGKRQQFAEDTKKQLESKVGSFIGEEGILPTRTKDYTSAQQEAIKNLQKGLTSGELSPQFKEQLGLQTGTRLFDVGKAIQESPQQFYSLPSITPETVASQQELASLSGLGRLAGRVDPYLTPSGLPSYDPTRPLTLQPDYLKGYLGQKEATYQQALAQPFDVSQMFTPKVPSTGGPVPRLRAQETVAVAPGQQMSIPQAESHIAQSKARLDALQQEVSPYEPDLAYQPNANPQAVETINRYRELLNRAQADLDRKKQEIASQYGALNLLR